MRLSKKTLIDLGFYQVIELIEKNLLLEDSKKNLNRRNFLDTKEEINELQNKIQDMIFIIKKRLSKPF